jgi:hypothetical protein
VPGTGEVTAKCSPAILFKSVDLPTFGAPTRATTGKELFIALSLTEKAQLKN